MEADFRRDYGIILVDELPTMTWRDFQVLLDGLSPYGAVASHYDEAIKAQRSEQPSTPGDADRFWQSLASIAKPM